MNEIIHPAYGTGEIVARYPSGAVLARFGHLPGGKYEGRRGPVIMAVLQEGQREAQTARPASLAD